jgi:hypothetical protein
VAAGMIGGYMPLIDDQGRLFGKLNIVDAAIGIVVGLLIPLVYGAYLLFRPPLPRLVAIEPSQVEQGTTRVDVRGEHLSPTFRVTIGDFGARFLLSGPEHGVLELPPGLQPGSYDVALLDQYQVLGRLPGALTVMGPAATGTGELVAIGTFDAPDSARAQSLWRAVEAAGQDAARAWDVLDVQPPEPGFAYLPPPEGMPLGDGTYQVRAVVRFRCDPEGAQCSVFDEPLALGAVVALPVTQDGEIFGGFRIIDLHPVYTSVLDVALRATGCSQGAYLTPEELSSLREAARDGGTRGSVEDALVPSIESFDVQGETSSKGLIVTVHLRVPAVSTDAGWMHWMGARRASLLRTGENFVTGGRSHQLCGRIVEVGPPTLLN